jgi:hypothetical protein
LGFGYRYRKQPPLGERYGFDEDRSAIRKGSSPEVMASLCNFCITLANKLNTSITDLRFECARFYRKTIHLILEN